MEFRDITLTSRSVTIELENEDVFFCQHPYDIYLDGKKVIENKSENVFSLFGLEPDTSYQINVNFQKGIIGSILDIHCEIRTKEESVRLNVKRFGAKGDGENLDSGAIQAAIMACPEHGTVFLPKGIYYCTPIFLKSNITLEFDEGATLLGCTDRTLYPILPGFTMTTNEKDEYYLGTWEGNPLDSHASLLTGLHVENVSIIGRGILDGNAQHSDWWVNPKIKKVAWRPRTLFLKGCSRILVQGLSVINSPSWTIHPYLSTHLKFIDLTVTNHKDSPNTDGLDPESCSDVAIIGVNFSVGDDCIAIKSGKLYMGQRLKRPSERFVIRNCRMRHGHGAVVLGSEMAGGIKDIVVSQCAFEQTDRGLRIKTRRGRGEDARIDGITFNRITMKEVLTPFVMNMFYFCDPDGKTEYVWSKETLPVDAGTPYLGKFLFKNIECIDSEVATAFFYGLPEQPIEEIILEDIKVTFKNEAIAGQPAMMSFAQDMSKAGIVAHNVKRLILRRINVIGYEGERLITSGINEIIEA
jgi:polygalacturonase